MDAKELRRLLQKSESPKLDFKRELPLSNKKEKSEFYKDLIAIANGNVDTANEFGYLIIGADDKTRDLFDVGALEIDPRATLNSLHARCHPAFVTPICEQIELDGKNLLVITIPPSDFLYTLTQTLGRFKEGDVLLRRKDGEETYEATSQERIRIERQKANRQRAQKSELYEKLTNLTFISEQISSGRLSALLDAYSKNSNNPVLSNPLDRPDILRLLQATFRLSEATLIEDANQLSSQLIGRLLFVQDSGVQEFLEKVKQYQEDQNLPWLEPLSSSLKPPIAFLLYDDLREHRKPVKVLTIDADSSKLVSASSDGQLKLWNLDQLEKTPLCASIQTHIDEVNKVIITADKNAQKIISASADCTVKVWGINEKKLLFNFEGHEECINSIALTLDSQQVISASDNGKLRVWSLVDTDIIPLIKEETFNDLGTDIFLTTDGQYAFFSTDSFISIWNLLDYSVHKIPAHEARINNLYFFPKQKKLISVSDDETLKIWEFEQDLHQLASRNGYRSLSHLSITPNGKSIIFVDDDDSNNLVIWDWEDNEIISLENRHRDIINTLAVVSHGKWLITGSKDQTLQIWDLDNRQWLGKIKEYKSDEPIALTVTPNGKYFIIALDDKSLEVWNLLDSETISVKTHTNKVSAIESIADGKRALSISEDQSFNLWQVNDGSLLNTFKSDGWISAYAVDNQRVIFAASGEKDILVMRNLFPFDDNEVKLDERSSLKVNSIVIAPTGKYAISASENKSETTNSYDLIVWNLEDAKVHRYLEGHLSPVTDIVFNPEKNILISESADKTIIWNLKIFNLLYAFSKPPNFARQLLKHIKIFPKDQFLVYEMDTTDLEIWDLTCGELFFTLPGRKDQVTAIAVTVDREQIISNSDKNGLEFWSIQDNNKPSYLSSVEHSAIITFIATTRCNCYAISASDDHTIKVWSIKDGSLIATFTGESEITACSVLDDELVIIAGEKSGRIHFLKLQGI